VSITDKTTHATTRHAVVVTLFLFAFVALVWRMVDLTVINRSFLQKQGDARVIRQMVIPAYRGMITDRNGAPLAISTPVDSLWINPQDFVLDHPKLKQLLTMLNLSHPRLTAVLEQAKDREFVYIKRGLNPNLAKKLMALKIPGVYFQREFHRYYPEGEVTAHLLGFTDIDDHGQEGIELAYNTWLQGVAGKKRVMKDRMGHIIADVATITEPQPGNNLALSIDKRIQYQAYRELKAAVDRNQAESGSVVVMDVHNGEVLAMVNQPSFNPNDRRAYHAASFRNRSITDRFEPGSVMKAFTLSAALASGQYTTSSTINTSPGYLKINNNLVQDFRDYGKLTLAEILKRSSNVGVTKITLSLPEQFLWTLLQRFGFGELALGTLPGESRGRLSYRSHWSKFMLATLAFGYGIAVTPVQLARAYAVFGNGGKLLPVKVILTAESLHWEQVLQPPVAKQVLHLLEAVVESGGTGRLARVKGYRVAGKTSTVRLLGAKGYQRHHHLAIFIGLAPADKPRVVTVVVIRDPKVGEYFGGRVAAPVFSRIMARVLPILHVTPNSVRT
jgi:cell division protein FtsI (penicillin-binding protein 3)